MRCGQQRGGFISGYGGFLMGNNTRWKRTER
jgi:hypothetical protein